MVLSRGKRHKVPVERCSSKGGNCYWFPRSCVVTLYVMHSHAGAWEREKAEHWCYSSARDYAGKPSLLEVCRQWGYTFPRSCVVTLYVVHSHAGAWEREIIYVPVKAFFDKVE